MSGAARAKSAVTLTICSPHAAFEFKPSESTQRAQATSKNSLDTARKVLKDLGKRSLGTVSDRTPFEAWRLWQDDAREGFEARGAPRGCDATLFARPAGLRRRKHRGSRHKPALVIEWTLSGLGRAWTPEVACLWLHLEHTRSEFSCSAHR
jgi:hypothetical protein